MKTPIIVLCAISIIALSVGGGVLIGRLTAKSSTQKERGETMLDQVTRAERLYSRYLGQPPIGEVGISQEDKEGPREAAQSRSAARQPESSARIPPMPDLSGPLVYPEVERGDYPGLTPEQFRVLEETICAGISLGFTADDVVQALSVTEQMYGQLGRCPKSTEIERAAKGEDWDDIAGMAKGRLEKDPHDLVALLLLSDYHLGRYDIDEFLKDAHGIMKAIRDIETPAMSRIKPRLMYDILFQLSWLSNVSRQEFDELHRKAQEHNVARLSCLPYIMACEMDKLW